MKNKLNKMIMIMFILFIGTVNSLNLLSKDRVFSEAENRILASKPDLSWQSIINGKYMHQFEDYITDQFVGRDFWVGLKSNSERLRLKQDNNGVFFGKDGYLLENYLKPSEMLIDRSIGSINYFQSIMKQMKTYVMLAPTSIKVNEDKLPPFAAPYDELLTLNGVEEMLSNPIEYIDVYTTLANKHEEYLYFKTDHHWTMRGAYYAYLEWAKAMHITPYALEDFNIEIISQDFYGTLYSKANYYHISPDYIEVFTMKDSPNLIIDYIDKEGSTNSLFEESHLSTKDKYAYFLDGNHPLMTIKSDSDNGKKLIIFKNSYAHVLIPFLVNHYEEIHVVDLRFYKLNIYDYIRDNNITESLFLYDVLNFSKDDSLSVLKAYE